MQPEYAVHVTREDAVGKSLAFRAGYSRMLPEDSGRPDFNLGLERIISSGKLEGFLPDGSKVDDRKYKFNKPQLEGNNIIIPLGVTSYEAYQSDVERATQGNFAEINRRRWLGEEKYNDALAYFASPLGVEVLIITSDGNVIFKKRNPNTHETFTEQYNTCSKFVAFKEGADPKDLSLDDDINSALRYKFKIEPHHLYVERKLVGIASDIHTGGNAIMFIQRLTLRSADLPKVDDVHMTKDFSEIKGFAEKLESPAPYLLEVLTEEDIKPL